jgi:hypothetical protein
MSAATLPHKRLVVSTLLAAQAITALMVLFYIFPTTRVSETQDIREFSERVKAVTSLRARCALTEVGGFGFYSGRYVVDLVGLVDRASLRWLKSHGKIGDVDSLEAILADRGAQYYIDSFAGSEPIPGKRFRFVPILEGSIHRNNFSRGSIDADRWRLYKLEPAGDRAGD